LAAALAAMTLLTFVQVVLRYVFQSGLVWSLEATTYLFGWLVLIGMSYGVRTRAHIATDLLTRRLAPVAARVVASAALGLSLVYCGLMGFGSLRLLEGLWRLGNRARDIPVPVWLLTSVMLLGFALLALRLLQAGWSYFRPGNGAGGRS